VLPGGVCARSIIGVDLYDAAGRELEGVVEGSEVFVGEEGEVVDVVAVID
jgi:hypothetical protein